MGNIWDGSYGGDGCEAGTFKSVARSLLRRHTGATLKKNAIKISKMLQRKK